MACTEHYYNIYYTYYYINGEKNCWHSSSTHHTQGSFFWTYCTTYYFRISSAEGYLLVHKYNTFTILYLTFAFKLNNRLNAKLLIHTISMNTGWNQIKCLKCRPAHSALHPSQLEFTLHQNEIAKNLVLFHFCVMMIIKCLFQCWSR